MERKGKGSTGKGRMLSEAGKEEFREDGREQPSPYGPVRLVPDAHAGRPGGRLLDLDRCELAREVAELLDLAITRSRGSVRAGERIREPILKVLVSARKEIELLEEELCNPARGPSQETSSIESLEGLPYKRRARS